MVASAVAIALLGLGCVLLAVLAWFMWRSRVQALKERAGQEAGKDMKNLIYQSAYAMGMGPTASATARSCKNIVECKEMAFVVTDIEGSTQLSVAGRDVYDQLLAIHDQLMREGIAKFHGTQIVTEGDSFLIAFHVVADAIAFCMDLQFKLLDTPWPRAVLRLPGCQPVNNADGNLVIQGPRVRMGVHWALPGLVACRPHALTKAPMIVGIAVSIAQEISDSAHGGQILLSQEAWGRLCCQMPQAGFPIVRRLGLYQLQAEEGKSSWLYTVDGSLLRPVRREMPPPRKLVQVWPPPGAVMAHDWGLYVNDPPVPLHGRADELTFVSLRLRLPLSKGNRRRRYGGYATGHRSAQQHQVPSSVLLAMQQLFVKQAQQFEGYLFGSDALTDRRGYFSFAFASPSNALRFCHTVQVCLMYNRWPDAALEYFGQTVIGIDGRLVFKGPRVAAAIHCGANYDIMPMASYHPTAAAGADYRGPAVALARALADAAHGGQVLMTEEAWQGVQDLLQAFPSAMYTINLGLHVVTDEFRRPRYLYEVMPTLLSGRSFKPPNTLQQLELGYREAPSVHEPMTIVFVKVAKPAAVSRAEASADDLGEEQVLEAITAYQLAVGHYSALARSLLTAYGGYECKEPEPGKFTMAFGCLTDAIAWACHIQKDLLQIAWPPALLRMSGCEALCGERGQRLWHGLRVRVGMACGYINVKKPMNTGRADYFGELANTAARVAALAAPGQILLESSQVVVNMPNGSPLLLEHEPTYLPVKWASSNESHSALIARHHESTTDGGGEGVGAGGSGLTGPVSSSPRRPGAGGRVRRASYSSGITETTRTLGFLPMALPFQRVTRAGGGGNVECPPLSSAALMLLSPASRRRMSLLELTSRSLSLGTQGLMALRRKSRTGSAGGVEGAFLSAGGPAGCSKQQSVEHIELRALGRFLLRGLDNPKLLYQALPESLLERTYPVPTEALVSRQDSSVPARGEANSGGGLLGLLRRTAGRMAVGATRGAANAGSSRASSRRKQLVEEAAADPALGGMGGASTDDGLKATIRHASDLTNPLGLRTPSMVVRAARHHSTIVPPRHPRGRTKNHAALSGAEDLTGHTIRGRPLLPCHSIQPERANPAESRRKKMRRSSTSPRQHLGVPLYLLRSADPCFSRVPMEADPDGTVPPGDVPQTKSWADRRSVPAAERSCGGPGDAVTPVRRLTEPVSMSNASYVALQSAADFESSPVFDADLTTSYSALDRNLVNSGTMQLGNMNLGACSYSLPADGQQQNAVCDPASGVMPRAGAAISTFVQSLGGVVASAAAAAVAAVTTTADSAAGTSTLLSSGVQGASSPVVSEVVSKFHISANGSVGSSVLQSRPLGVEAPLSTSSGPLALPLAPHSEHHPTEQGGSGDGDGEVQSYLMAGPCLPRDTPCHVSGGSSSGVFSVGREAVPTGMRPLPTHLLSACTSPGLVSQGAGQLGAAAVRMTCPSSPLRDRVRFPSPLGGAATAALSGDSFTGANGAGRRMGRSLLGIHHVGSLQVQMGQLTSGSVAEGLSLSPSVVAAAATAATSSARPDGIGDVASRLAPPPTAVLQQQQASMLQVVAALGIGQVSTVPEIEPVSSSSQPSVTVRLQQSGQQWAEDAGNTVVEKIQSSNGSGSPTLTVHTAFSGPIKPKTVTTSLKKLIFGSLATWTQKSFLTRAKPDRDPDAGSSSILAGSTIGTTNIVSTSGLSSLGTLVPAGHQGALSDLRVRAVLRAANVQQAVMSDAGSHDASHSGGSLQLPAGESPRRGQSAALTQHGDSSDCSSQPSPQRAPPRLPSILWKRLRGIHLQRDRRCSDVGQGQGTGLRTSTGGDSQASVPQRPGPAHRCHSVMMPPLLSATHTSCQLSGGNLTLPNSNAPSGASSRSRTPVRCPAAATAANTRRHITERAMDRVMHVVRPARAPAPAGGEAGMAVYSPPGSNRGRRMLVGSPVRHSFSSSASSVYSGTASPRVTMAGNEQGQGHGVTGLLATVFGRGQNQRRTSHSRARDIAAGFRRRSAHVVLSEAARLELLQRSAAHAEACPDTFTSEGAEGTPQSFAAAVARTYVEHRRQQQQQQQQQQHLRSSVGGAGGLISTEPYEGGMVMNSTRMSPFFEATGTLNVGAGGGGRGPGGMVLPVDGGIASGSPSPEGGRLGGAVGIIISGRTSSGALQSGSITSTRGSFQPPTVVTLTAATSGGRGMLAGGFSHEHGTSDMHSVDELGPVEFGMPGSRETTYGSTGAAAIAAAAASGAGAGTAAGVGGYSEPVSVHHHQQQLLLVTREASSCDADVLSLQQLRSSRTSGMSSGAWKTTTATTSSAKHMPTGPAAVAGGIAFSPRSTTVQTQGLMPSMGSFDRLGAAAVGILAAADVGSLGGSGVGASQPHAHALIASQLRSGASDAEVQPAASFMPDFGRSNQLASSSSHPQQQQQHSQPVRQAQALPQLELTRQPSQQDPFVEPGQDLGAPGTCSPSTSCFLMHGARNASHGSIASQSCSSLSLQSRSGVLYGASGGLAVTPTHGSRRSGSSAQVMRSMPLVIQQQLCSMTRSNQPIILSSEVSVTSAVVEERLLLVSERHVVGGSRGVVGAGGDDSGRNDMLGVLHSPTVRGGGQLADGYCSPRATGTRSAELDGSIGGPSDVRRSSASTCNPGLVHVLAGLAVQGAESGFTAGGPALESGGGGGSFITPPRSSDEHRRSIGGLDASPLQAAALQSSARDTSPIPIHRTTPASTASTPSSGHHRGPRIIEASLPGPSHPLYYNIPMSEWTELGALAALTEATEATVAAANLGGSSVGSSAFRRSPAFSMRRSARKLAASMHSQPQAQGQAQAGGAVATAPGLSPGQTLRVQPSEAQRLLPGFSVATSLVPHLHEQQRLSSSQQPQQQQQQQQKPPGLHHASHVLERKAPSLPHLQSASAPAEAAQERSQGSSAAPTWSAAAQVEGALGCRPQNRSGHVSPSSGYRELALHQPGRSLHPPLSTRTSPGLNSISSPRFIVDEEDEGQAPLGLQPSTESYRHLNNIQWAPAAPRVVNAVSPCLACLPSDPTQEGPFSDGTRIGGALYKAPGLNAYTQMPRLEAKEHGLQREQPSDSTSECEQRTGTISTTISASLSAVIKAEVPMGEDAAAVALGETDGQGVHAILRRTEMELLAQLGRSRSTEEASEITRITRLLQEIRRLSFQQYGTMHVPPATPAFWNPLASTDESPEASTSSSTFGPRRSRAGALASVGGGTAGGYSAFKPPALQLNPTLMVASGDERPSPFTTLEISPITPSQGLSSTRALASGPSPDSEKPATIATQSPSVGCCKSTIQGATCVPAPGRLVSSGTVRVGSSYEEHNNKPREPPELHDIFTATVSEGSEPGGEEGPGSLFPLISGGASVAHPTSEAGSFPADPGTSASYHGSPANPFMFLQQPAPSPPFGLWSTKSLRAINTNRSRRASRDPDSLSSTMQPPLGANTNGSASSGVELHSLHLTPRTVDRQAAFGSSMPSLDAASNCNTRMGGGSVSSIRSSSTVQVHDLDSAPALAPVAATAPVAAEGLPGFQPLQHATASGLAGTSAGDVDAHISSSGGGYTGSGRTNPQATTVQATVGSPRLSVTASTHRGIHSGGGAMLGTSPSLCDGLVGLPISLRLTGLEAVESGSYSLAYLAQGASSCISRLLSRRLSQSTSQLDSSAHTGSISLALGTRALQRDSADESGHVGSGPNAPPHRLMRQSDSDVTPVMEVEAATDDNSSGAEDAKGRLQPPQPPPRPLLQPEEPEGLSLPEQDALNQHDLIATAPDHPGLDTQGSGFSPCTQKQCAAGGETDDSEPAWYGGIAMPTAPPVAATTITSVSGAQARRLRADNSFGGRSGELDGTDGDYDDATDRPSQATMMCTVPNSDRTSAFSLQSMTDRSSATTMMYGGDRYSNRSYISGASARTDLDVGLQGWQRQHPKLNQSRSEAEGSDGSAAPGRFSLSGLWVPQTSQDGMWSPAAEPGGTFEGRDGDGPGRFPAEGAGGISGRVLYQRCSRSLGVHGSQDSWTELTGLVAPDGGSGGARSSHPEAAGGGYPESLPPLTTQLPAVRSGRRSSTMAAVAEVDLEADSPRVRTQG